MLQISELFIYPVKSLGGIRVSSAQLTDRGFQYDRRWMLVDENNRFLTQREYPQMALLQPHIHNEGLKIVHKNDPAESIIIPFLSEKDKANGFAKTNTDKVVNVWDDYCEALPMDQSINEWFSDQLHLTCKLVYMPDETRRKVDPRYAVNETNITSFSDGYPVLVISQASLDDLNNRLEHPLPMNRFRPNIVITGATPYEEDEMEVFRIGDINFFGVKLSARCVMITINQDSGEKGKEPLRTLYRYRSMNNKVYFGQNVLYENTGVLKMGNIIEIIKRKPAVKFEHG
ncbi:MAG: MOSC N-terminal beta barrel domain-containing protein [Chitinophagaceae bacterium]